MFSKLMTQASQFAMEGVKNLVVKKHVSCLLILVLIHAELSDSLRLHSAVLRLLDL